MKDMKRRLLALVDTWKTLDKYANHPPGCPAIWGGGGACDCGLTPARIALRDAALELLDAYAVHDDGCAGATGERCECGIENARRWLQDLTRVRLAGGAGGSLPPKDL